MQLNVFMAFNKQNNSVSNNEGKLEEEDNRGSGR